MIKMGQRRVLFELQERTTIPSSWRETNIKERNIDRTKKVPPNKMGLKGQANSSQGHITHPPTQGLSYMNNRNEDLSCKLHDARKSR